MKYQCIKCGLKDVIVSSDKYHCNNCNLDLTDNDVIRIIIVSKDKKNGQHKCINCGATEILFNERIGSLECKYCGCLFKEESDDLNKIKILKGKFSGEASLDINKNFENIKTIKCGGCGAEVVVDVNDKQVFRCQWCRSILSLNDICDSGFIPDKILPFKLTKEEALSNMKKYLSLENRDYFSHEEFKSNLELENIIGVYIPYMLVDVNSHSKLKGVGKHIVNYKNTCEKKKYNINVYNVEREFDLYVDDLSLESNSNRKNIDSDERANNILNAVMPFDTENALKYKGNYLIGFNAEKRDLNQDDLEIDLENKIINISKAKLKKDKDFYMGGLEWNDINTEIIGTKWMSIYLPIWLYSYQENHEDRKVLHYVAVNGRTGKTMGSAPLNESVMKKSHIYLLLAVFCMICPFVFMLYSYLSIFFDSKLYSFAVIVFLLIYLFFILKKGTYNATVKHLRNKEAKFDYVKLTKKSFSNIQKKDEKVDSYQDVL